MTHFEGVVPALSSALVNRGYETLTPVQQAVINPDLNNKDALVSAQTGSGKTVAFGLAIAPTLLGESEKFSKAGAPLALVVAPTRELAMQVKRELDWLYAETGAIISSCVGGMDARTERRALERGTHIVVGTPGRLCDHIRRGALITAEMQAVVLDEADEMLDLGFREDLEFILETTPEDRRTLMFSATVPPTIGKMAARYQKNAVRLETAGEKKQHSDIDYRALVTAPREKENAIINVLRYYEAENAIVFCNTRAAVNHMLARLNNRGFQVVALSGELSQAERTHALQALRDGRARVCIATDVAARGLDLPKLDLVIHADLPTNPETLLHRSGRTGRAGRKGISALIIEGKARGRAERILRFAKIKANWDNPPSAEAINARDEERMLADPMLSDTITPDEQTTVTRLLEAHKPEQVAAAFLRLTRAGKSAPEDVQIISANAPQERAHNSRDSREREPRAPRENFENSVWISLSIGRKHRAEPRWLIPMLCNKSGLTKRDLGTITLQQEETIVQLNADMADQFFSSLGANSTLEKNVRVKRVDEAASRQGNKPTRGKHPRGKPPRDRSSKPYAKPEAKAEGKPSGKSEGTKKSNAPKKKNMWNKNTKSASPTGDQPQKRKKPKRKPST